MKKYAMLLLVVLMLSTSAWASTLAYVTVSPACPNCVDNVCINVLACVPKACTVTEVDSCVRTNNMILVDIYLECPDCSCGGSTKVDETVCVGDLCPGTYFVVARVYWSGACCKSTPTAAAVGSTVFKVSCATCAWPWWW
jgi:hypothetical protein